MIRQSEKKLKTSISPPDHLVLANSFQELEAITDINKNLAILSRCVNPRLDHFIQNLDLRLFPNIQTSFYAYECSKNLQTLLQEISTDEEGLTLFIHDLATVTENFCSVSQTELVRFKLEVVNHDMCKYFHCDFNNLRLMCTYHGDGTIWATNENVNRAKLGCKNNDEIIVDPSLLYQLETFWIGIFKGEVFMNNSGNGIVHRSPSVNGKKRILLRLDV